MLTRSIRLMSIALLLSLGVTALQPVRPAFAAGYIVNTLTDTNIPGDGLCSLREAISRANNAGNGDCGPNSPNNDVINFLVNGTIRLGSTLFIAGGEGALTINGKNTIILSGDTNNDGTGDVRVLYVELGGDLALVNLTVTLGDAGAASGGGAVNLGSLMVINGTFSKNSAMSSGGGIDNDGKFTSFNSTFINNQANGFSTGGGIYSAPESAMFIVHSTFVNNTGGTGGGGISNEGTATISDSTFSGNTASVPNGTGGGILQSYRGSLTMFRGTFSGNQADHGGGLWSSGPVSITGTTFSNNSGDTDGGGITNYGTLTITRATFVDNSVSYIATSPGNGGGIFNGNGFDGVGKLNVTRSTFLRNSAGRGGGLYNDSYAQIYNSTFADNAAFNAGEGGGIYFKGASGVLYLTYSTLSGNSATWSGGGIFTGSGDVTGGGGSGGSAYVSFTIVANSPTGGNCSGTFFWEFDNLATDNTCGFSFVQVTPAQLNFGPLTGTPAYFPLNPGSVAIDAGDTLLCGVAFVNNESQNGLVRPQDGNADGTAICDIGSYEAPRR